MEAINELIERYGIEEDLEHIIIPLPDRGERCFLLKRKFIRLVYPDGHYTDYPLEEVIEAIIKYPEFSLSKALFHLYREFDVELPQMSGNES